MAKNRHRHNNLRISITLIVATVVLLLNSTTPEAQQPPPFVTLGIERDHLVLNGGSKHLYFVSYFDGMRAYDRSASSVEEDFEFFKQHYIDGVRVFPNWWADCGWDGDECDVNTIPTDTLFDGSGNLRSSRLAVLKNLIELAAQEGLVVDVSFAREVTGLSVSAFGSAIAATTAELSGYGNVIFDIQNERNLSDRQDQYLSFSDVTTIRAAIKSADSDRIVTASNDQSMSPSDAGDFQLDADLDVAAYHEERGSTWYDSVDYVVSEMWYASPWNVVVYLQEPMPWQDDPNSSHFAAAAAASKHWGGAAWTYHTRTGHDLSSYSFSYKISHAESGSAYEDGQMVRTLKAFRHQAVGTPFSCPAVGGATVRVGTVPLTVYQAGQ